MVDMEGCKDRGGGERTREKSPRVFPLRARRGLFENGTNRHASSRLRQTARVDPRCSPLSGRRLGCCHVLAWHRACSTALAVEASRRCYRTPVSPARCAPSQCVLLRSSAPRTRRSGARLRDRRLDTSLRAGLTDALYEEYDAVDRVFRIAGPVHHLVLGGDGLGRATQTILPAAYLPANSPRRLAVGRPARIASMPVRPGDFSSPAPGRSTILSMLSPPARDECREPCPLSTGMGFSATAPATARAARSRASARQLLPGRRQAVGVSKKIRQAYRVRAARLVRRSHERPAGTPLSRFRRHAIRLAEGVLLRPMPRCAR